MTFPFKPASLAAAISLLATGAANAASATRPADATAGLFDLGAFLNTVLTQDGGFAIIVLGIVLGAVMLAVTSRWTYLAASAGVALFLGFGVPVITSVAGVTADVEMISSAGDAAAPVSIILPQG